MNSESLSTGSASFSLTHINVQLQFLFLLYCIICSRDKGNVKFEWPN